VTEGLVFGARCYRNQNNSTAASMCLQRFPNNAPGACEVGGAGGVEGLLLQHRLPHPVVRVPSPLPCLLRLLLLFLPLRPSLRAKVAQACPQHAVQYNTTDIIRAQSLQFTTTPAATVSDTRTVCRPLSVTEYRLLKSVRTLHRRQALHR
jgi:hypothetical protein